MPQLSSYILTSIFPFLDCVEEGTHGCWIFFPTSYCISFNSWWLRAGLHICFQRLHGNMLHILIFFKKRKGKTHPDTASYGAFGTPAVAHPWVCLSIRPSIRLSTHPPSHPSIHLSTLYLLNTYLVQGTLLDAVVILRIIGQDSAVFKEVMT